MKEARTGTAKRANERAEAAATTTPPHFFQLIPPTVNVNFVGMRLRMLIVSWVLILIGLASIWMRGGLNYGIDFSGGTLVHLRFAQPAAVSDVRAAVESKGLEGVVVQAVGQEGREYQVRAATEDEGESDKTAADIQGGLREKFGDGAFEVMRIEAVGPKVGRDLWRSAALAVLAATVMMGIYIAIRFDFRFGIGAAVAVLHDVLMTIGAISIANLEFDLTTVAALLTVVGYSVNDTVVISDRIRENLRKMRRESLATVMNVSINETLSRTIITGGTAIIATAVLFWMGGPVIHSFAFTMLFGFIVGTYSSIFIASPIVLYLERGTRKKT
jgi:preprotein translocase subunit SecF